MCEKFGGDIGTCWTRRNLDQINGKGGEDQVKKEESKGSQLGRGQTPAWQSGERDYNGSISQKAVIFTLSAVRT
jgi:hypothetical protein